MKIATILCVEALALAAFGAPSDNVSLSGATVEDLEIIAGAVWNAVGGVDDGQVTVRDVDPKSFGVEVAAGTEVEWVFGDTAGSVKQITLATLRPFKPMDMIITELEDEGDGTINVVTGLTEIRNVEIGGVNQFTAKNPVSSQCFGSTLSAPRPRIRFDTVQTSPSLSMDMAYRGGTIGASASVRATAVFSGVAIKRTTG